MKVQKEHLCKKIRLKWPQYLESSKQLTHLGASWWPQGPQQQLLCFLTPRAGLFSQSVFRSLQQDLLKLLVQVKICLQQESNRYHYISHRKVIKVHCISDSVLRWILLVTQQASPESCKSARPCCPHTDLPQVIAFRHVGGSTVRVVTCKVWYIKYQDNSIL